MEGLPDELLFNIAANLDSPRDLNTFTSLNRNFYRFSNDDRYNLMVQREYKRIKDHVAYRLANSLFYIMNRGGYVHIRRKFGILKEGNNIILQYWRGTGRRVQIIDREYLSKLIQQLDKLAIYDLNIDEYSESSRTNDEHTQFWRNLAYEEGWGGNMQEEAYINIRDVIRAYVNEELSRVDFSMLVSY